MNYSTTNTITGIEKRQRVGSVVAKAHQTMMGYRHMNVVCEKWALETQEGESLLSRRGRELI
jgi:hypothetical protein